MTDILHSYFSKTKPSRKCISNNFSCPNINQYAYKHKKPIYTKQTRCSSVKSMFTNINKSMNNSTANKDHIKINHIPTKTKHYKEVQCIINKLLSKSVSPYKKLNPSIYTRKYNKYLLLQREIIDKQELIKENFILSPKNELLYKSFSKQNKYMGGSKYRNSLIQSINSYQTDIKQHSHLKGEVVYEMKNMPRLKMLKQNFFKEINKEITGNTMSGTNANKYKRIINEKKVLFRPISIPINHIGFEDRMKKWDNIVNKTRLHIQNRQNDLETKRKSFELIINKTLSKNINNI